MRSSLLVWLLIYTSVVEGGFDPSFWQFVPIHEGELFSNGTSIKWSAACFQVNTAHLETSSGTAVITAASRSGDKCSDLYLFATNQNFHVRRISDEGNHEVAFEWRNAEEKAYVADYGLQVFLIQDGVIGSLEDLALTIELFVGPKTAVEQRLFFEQHLNYTFVPRSNTVVLNQSDVLSGDYLAILKTTEANSGVNDMICYGTGSHTGHAAAALWMDGQLYVVESTAELGPGEASGVIKTPWADWMAAQKKAGTMVALLRLNETIRARFDEEQAVAFFKSVEGLPYGYHNFIFGWIDTPADNYPPPVSAEIFPLVFQLLDHIDHVEADRLAGQGLNKRLNTTGLRMYDLYLEMERRNISFYDVMAYPEQDSWVYSDGKSLVCDVFVVELFRAAGAFGDLDFQATELTPKDSYQLDIYEHNWQRPAACLVDADLPYCQLLGDYKLTLPGFNSIPPYDNMFQTCGGLPPTWAHSSDC